MKTVFAMIQVYKAAKAWRDARNPVRGGRAIRGSERKQYGIKTMDVAIDDLDEAIVRAEASDDYYRLDDETSAQHYLSLLFAACVDLITRHHTAMHKDPAYHALRRMVEEYAAFVQADQKVNPRPEGWRAVVLDAALEGRWGDVSRTLYSNAFRFSIEGGAFVALAPGTSVTIADDGMIHYVVSLPPAAPAVATGKPECTCGQAFRTAEDYRDHLPCQPTYEGPF